MSSLFNLSHIRERYSACVSDRSVSIHATLAEMVGTGMVVLIGTGAIELSDEARGLQSSSQFNPVDRHNTYLNNAVIWGLIYFVVMCATRHHGGAHLNPVLTIASMLAGVCGALQAIVFITVQVLGAIIGSAIVRGLKPSDLRDDALLGANFYDEARADVTGNTKSRAFGVEIIATFVLTYVFLQVYYHPRCEHKTLAPLALGLAYTALLANTGPVSSGSLNPARSLGPAAVASFGDDLWIWTIGPLVGALIAVPFHLISVTDLPSFDKEGKMIKKSSSAVDIAQADDKAGAAGHGHAVQSAV